MTSDPDLARHADTFAGQPVLVTGGLGFIGSNLALRLAELGAAVTVLDSLLPDYGGNRTNLAGWEDRIRIEIGDVRDAATLRRLLQGCRFVFNLAAQTSHLDSMRQPFFDLDVNCRAQLVLLEVLREVAPDAVIVYASTRQIYGRPHYLPVDERHPLRPVDVNGVNKMAGEAYHLLFHDAYGVAASVLRLTNTFGPRMRIKDARQTFIGVWLRALLEERPIEVWGGAQKRDLTFVDDAVAAFLAAAATPATRGRVFNVGGCEPVSLEALAAALIAANGSGRYEVKSFPDERKRIDIGDYYGDDSALRQTTEWRPRIGLADGLKRSLDYYRDRLHAYV